MSDEEKDVAAMTLRIKNFLMAIGVILKELFNALAKAVGIFLLALLTLAVCGVLFQLWTEYVIILEMYPIVK